MKKKLFLWSLILHISSSLSAQSTDTKGEINTLINSQLIPVFIFIMVCGFLGVLAYNFDGLRGKNGANSHDAWIEVIKGAVFVFAATTVLYLVVNRLSSISFSI